MRTPKTKGTEFNVRITELEVSMFSVVELEMTLKFGFSLRPMECL